MGGGEKPPPKRLCNRCDKYEVRELNTSLCLVCRRTYQLGATINQVFPAAGEHLALKFLDRVFDWLQETVKEAEEIQRESLLKGSGGDAPRTSGVASAANEEPLKRKTVESPQKKASQSETSPKKGSSTTSALAEGREELAQREANEQRERIDRSEAVAAPSEPRAVLAVEASPPKQMEPHGQVEEFAQQADTEDKAAVGEDIPKAVQASQLIPSCHKSRLPRARALKAAPVTLLRQVSKEMAPDKSTLASEHEASPPNTPTINPEKHIIEVYNWNLDHEFNNLLAAASGDASGNAILAIDMEFPGFLRQEPRICARAARYQTVRENVDRLRLIQLGAAVADADGTVRGAWSFNLKFDIEVDLHTEKSMQFLRAAGLDFPRHKKEGIDPVVLGRKLANSSLVGQRAPSWVTFAGSYDLAYLLKLLTSGQPLPRDYHSFDVQLSIFCRRHHELRDVLPSGSLDAWARYFAVQRYGRSHTAGSDALLTLNLFLCIMAMGTNCFQTTDRKWDAWQWQEQWDAQCWEMAQQARWQAAAWQYQANSAYYTALSTQPPAPWHAFSQGPPVPALHGGLPMPAAAFWNSASPFSMNQDVRNKFQI
ncbi:unnamed protein product [Durusdinium trenchii]|uniref:poly(A)-specific ribonuclease n=1 Tax=Durusdinium trenchii TaxID=1381693 RepID=A0ABP0NU84_9DINO